MAEQGFEVGASRPRFRASRQLMVDAALRLALTEAHAATDAGDVPVGAVVLDSAGEPVGRGGNQREANTDPTAHAEVVALRAAAVELGKWRLSGCTLAVTLEPCTMCAGAIVQARIGVLIYGARDPKAGAVGSLWDVVRDRRLNHIPEVIPPDLVSQSLVAECTGVLSEFFTARRLR